MKIIITNPVSELGLCAGLTYETPTDLSEADALKLIADDRAYLFVEIAALTEEAPKKKKVTNDPR